MLPFYNTLKEIYDFTAQFLPPVLKENPEFSAFGLATLYSYMIVKGIQDSVFHSNNKTLEKYLLSLEKVSLVSIISLTAIGFSDSYVARELQQHTVYTSGVSGLFLGVSVPMFNHIRRAYKKTHLE